MIVDTSALVAVLFDEPDHVTFRRAMLQAAVARASAANVVEFGIVASRHAGPGGEAIADSILEEFAIDVVPVDREQARLAQRAFRRFGKGRHPAGLNFGDLFAYALSKATGEPLLFKGDDFRKTDVEPAL